jgi:hypothetical protein
MSVDFSERAYPCSESSGLAAAAAARAVAEDPREIVVVLQGDRSDGRQIGLGAAQHTRVVEDGGPDRGHDVADQRLALRSSGKRQRCTRWQATQLRHTSRRPRFLFNSSNDLLGVIHYAPLASAHNFK